MIDLEEKEFCEVCKKREVYSFKKVPFKQVISNKEYEFEITIAVCENCGEEVGIPGILELNTNEINEQITNMVVL